MWKYGIVAGLLSATALFGQLDSNSVTVTASRNATLQPDQVVFSVRVESGLNTSLDDVLTALAGSGITQANFTGINTSQVVFTGNVQPQSGIEWLFSLPAPLAKIKETVVTLTTLQQNIAKQRKGLAMNFSVQGTQVSPQLQQSQTCSITDLLADARAQAQKLASAAGFTADTILAMSSVTETSVPTAIAALSSVLLPSSVPCTLTVKFNLVRFQ